MKKNEVKMAKSGSPILTSSWLEALWSCCIDALAQLAVAQNLNRL